MCGGVSLTTIHNTAYTSVKHHTIKDGETSTDSSTWTTTAFRRIGGADLGLPFPENVSGSFSPSRAKDALELRRAAPVRAIHLEEARSLASEPDAQMVARRTPMMVR